MKYHSFPASFLFTVLILSYCPYCLGQYGLSMGADISLPASQWFQPAAIAWQDYERLQVSTSGELWLSNNQFTIGSFIRGGNFITEATKNDIIGKLRDDNRYQQGYSLAGLINFQTGTQKWLLSFSYQDPFYIQADDSVTAGLIFRGNAPYAGMEISDNNVAIRSSAYAMIGLGTAWELGDWTLGIHPKFVWGRRADIIDELSYTLFTADNGSLISLQADYDSFATLQGDRGWGLALDAGAMYQSQNGMLWEVAFRNLGWMQWDGSQSNNSVDVDYEGVVWDNFIQDGSSTSNLALGDTLQTLFFPDSVRATYNLPTPGIAMAGLRYPLNEREMIFSSVQLGLTRMPPTTQFPLLHVGYQRKIGNNLTLGAHAYGGGMDLYGIGIYGKIELGPKTRWGLFYTMDNALGLLIPEISQGLSLRGGLFLRS